MKKIGFALFLFVTVRFSLFALPGARPYIFKIENLTTKESVTYFANDLIHSDIYGEQTPMITFSKGIYALDKIKITMSNPQYYFTVLYWTNSYNSQQESVLGVELQEETDHDASITYQIPLDLVQDNMSMDICAYLVFPVGSSSSSDDIENETKNSFNGFRYCFRFAEIHNTKRYTIREDPGDIVIGPPIINPHTSSEGNSTSIARLYDSFGNLKKTVVLNNSAQTHIYTGDLKRGLYLLKLTIDGITFTEKIII